MFEKPTNLIFESLMTIFGHFCPEDIFIKKHDMGP